MADPDVDDPSDAVAAKLDDWARIDALVGGTSAMRAAGEKYMPKFPAESDQAFQERVGVATLFPAFSRTASVLAAKPFTRPISIEGDIPAEVVALFDDVDMEGAHLNPFAARVMLEVMRKGIVGVLVDVPPSQGVRSKAEEKLAGVRPYLTIYPAQTILGWRTNKTGGAKVKGDEALTLLRLLESVEAPSGEWFTKPVPQVRVLRPGSWETWRKRVRPQGDEVWEKFEGGETSINKIAFVFFYATREGFGLSSIPLLELAHQNIKHWQSDSDQQKILHVARVPILFAKGFDEDDVIVVGASKACRSNSESAELSYVEHTGAAIEAGRQSLQDLKDDMRQIGAELLVQQPAVKTATQTTSDAEANRSTLQAITESAERSWEAVVRLMAEWLGLEAKPTVTLHKDFGAANLSEKGGDLLLRAAGDDHVSSQTVFDSLKRADVIQNDLTWEDEQLRLAKQPRGAPPKRDKNPGKPPKPPKGGGRDA